MLSRVSFRLRFDINLLRGFVEVLEERWAEPALHLEVRGKVPVAIVLFAPPLEPGRIAGEGRGREEEAKSLRGVRNVRHQTIHYGIRAGDEGLSVQADARVIEHPGAFIPVRNDEVDAVHLSESFRPYGKVCLNGLFLFHKDLLHLPFRPWMEHLHCVAARRNAANFEEAILVRGREKRM